MSREGLEVARRVSRKLPVFGSQREAQSRLFAARDTALSRLRAFALKADFHLDSTPESLKRIEAWYFALVASRGFRTIGVRREEFEDYMATYFCHVVATSHHDAKWVIEESPLAPGHFEIGVERGHCTWAGSFRDHYRAPANRSRTRVFRDYQKYFGRD